MITVQLNKRDFEYDIHSLIRAFYPGVDVPLYLEGEEEPQGFEKKLEVCYSEALIRLIWRDADGKELARRECAVDFYADRKQTKNALKAALYELLSEYTGQKLPWGNLTGIREKLPYLHAARQRSRWGFWSRDGRTRKLPIICGKHIIPATKRRRLRFPLQTGSVPF